MLYGGGHKTSNELRSHAIEVQPNGCSNQSHSIPRPVHHVDLRMFVGGDRCVHKKCFDQLWYTGFSAAASDPWPYFNLGESSGIGSPEWETATPNWIQSTIMVS